MFNAARWFPGKADIASVSEWTILTAWSSKSFSLRFEDTYFGRLALGASSAFSHGRLTSIGRSNLLETLPLRNCVKISAVHDAMDQL
jgi:hypothetical protein